VHTCHHLPHSKSNASPPALERPRRRGNVLLHTIWPELPDLPCYYPIGQGT